MESCHILGLLDLTPEGTGQLELSATTGEEARAGERTELLTGLSALQRTIETFFPYSYLANKGNESCGKVNRPRLQLQKEIGRKMGCQTQSAVPDSSTPSL